MSGQPNEVGNWVFDLAKLEATETAAPGSDVYEPSIIVNSPNTFKLTATLTNAGKYSKGLKGAAGKIYYHCNRMEDDKLVHLAAIPFTMGASPFNVVSPEVSTGPAGTLDIGTWMITAHVHFDPPFTGMVAAFSQSMIEVVEPS